MPAQRPVVARAAVVATPDAVIPVIVKLVSGSDVARVVVEPPKSEFRPKVTRFRRDTVRRDATVGPQSDALHL